MKLLVLLALLWLVKAETATNQEIKPKPTMQTLNSVTSSQKPEYYQPPQQQYQQPQYVQVIPKPIYQPHMIIIAQPAYLPPNLVYNNPTQQLLNYFHNNPQARYQLLHGYQPQQHYVHPNSIVSASPSIGHYQYVAAPTQYQTAPAQYETAPAQYQAAPTQYQAAPANQLPFPQAAPYHQPVGQLSQIAHLAQLAAQQYVHNPARSTPAIITGLENFTPEQQVKIKAQLNAHFGTPLQTLNSQQTSNKQELRYVASPQYPVRYQQPLTQNTNDFVPSQQIKSDTSAAGGSESLKSQQYHKM